MEEFKIDLESIVAEKVMAYQLFKKNSMIEMLLKELNELRIKVNDALKDK